MEEKLLVMQKGNLYGFININGEFIIEPIYKDAEEFCEGLSLVKTIDDKKCFINPKNEVVLNIEYESISSFTNGLAAFRQNGKAGYIDMEGNVAIEPQYDWINSEFNENGFSVVEVNHKHGVINKEGKYILQPIYDSIMNASDGIFSVTKNGKDGYVDVNGKIVIEFKFACAHNFSEELAIVHTENRKYGVINKTGEFVIEPRFNYLRDFKDGLAVFSEKENSEKLGYIDTEGNIVIKEKYYEAKDFTEGLAAVETNKGMGYIDKKGKLIIKDVFTTADDFKDGIACVTYKGNWGYVTRDKKWIYKPEGFDLW
ncbi:WG repeat-containing protein [Clostridium sp. JS66]|uniref:WG repeat-containing protein n=1 Tax=Clostridium sp. JS66 TaxID=3064705 RepID=UPI00298DF9A4|nr:WG repeat-containing protein [Clostridium sp. JS66]WPC42631.1 WG repeat-containing protein [Clostridium sp. JS66]